jgi:septal ring factor EnvC (AmiA/AmiB activator)
MKPLSKVILGVCCILALAAPLVAQHRDPLNEAESDQLREVAQEPYKRLKLMIKFASERLDTVEAAQKDTQARGRGQRVHDALQDFRELVDELDDNIDDFSQKQSDLRKALNEVVAAESSFDTRLKEIKAAAEDPKSADEYKMYSFALQDAMEAVSLSLEDAKKTLDDQNTALTKKK